MFSVTDHLAKIEVWRAIRDHPDYEVSNFGNVRSTDRNVPRGFGILRLKGRKLKLVLVKATGYYKVNLHKQELVHRLVAMAFCEGYEDGLEVNHKSGNRRDNHFENLEWVTPSQNIKHSYDVLGRIGSGTGLIGEKAFASKAVVSIDMVTGERRRWGSAMDAARAGFNNTSISACCSGARLHHKGHYWQFEDKYGELNVFNR